MYPPLPSFDEDEKTLLFKLLNRQYNTHLDANQIDVSRPTRVRDTLTKITLTPYASSPLRNSVELTYRRVDLTSFFYGETITVSWDPELSIDTLCQKLESQYNVRLDPLGFILTKDNVVPPSLPQVITIEASPDNVFWTGRLTAWMVGDDILSQEFHRNFTSPVGIRQKKNIYTYGQHYVLNTLDHNVVSALVGLQTLTTLNPTTHSFITYLKEQTGDDWCVEKTVKDFNLYGAKVRRPHDDPESPILLLTLGSACNNLFGTLPLNRPID